MSVSGKENYFVQKSFDVFGILTWYVTQAWNKIFSNRFVSVLPLLWLFFSPPFLLSLLALYDLPLRISECGLFLCRPEPGALIQNMGCASSVAVLSMGGSWAEVPIRVFLYFWMSAGSQLSRFKVNKTATVLQSLQGASSSPWLFFFSSLVWEFLKCEREQKESSWKWRKRGITKKPGCFLQNVLNFNSLQSGPFSLERHCRTMAFRNGTDYSGHLFSVPSL